ncbi:putative O-acyltransferase NDAI_0F02300 [Naumovozyma dairenensis CBS 421]|uniref:Uncharacterized protein n=1 Tax=Naumovozyma dairenensis (strain ATCC 10597 / BCRC 20456 / CBS 421 / NBRC 0211 / NRRL Y-12639) TaxID=1071378 RepID=G0WCN7_NAUDC|nr:hypothetical protein NDAI_0F02300 [Naumovozyma dairenensis CBS 421]CCD25548.1 hypothetical protein NDAI_0F02300 [Naumovozyma dairenensis CBS 421]
MSSCIAIEKIKYFFSVEALDSRITPETDLRKRQKLLSSNGNANNTNSSTNDKDLNSTNNNTASSSSLWRTWEFKFYYVAFLIVVPLMIKTAMDASNETNPNYYKFERLLSNGWLFNRKVDNSDAQYRFFRDNFLLLTTLMIAHLLIKKYTMQFLNITKLRFDCFFGLIFLFAAHGVNSLRILTHMTVLFSIVHVFKRNRRLATALTWTYGIAALFINDKYRTYAFGNILSILSPLDNGYKGIIPRWDVFFNFTLLRMISYNMDFLERWTKQLSISPASSSSSMADPQDSSEPMFRKSSSRSILEPIEESGKYQILNERARLTAPHHLQDYNIFNYIAYITYTPLFIAGPIITFNDYIYQTQHTLPSINRNRIIIYTARFVLCLLTMEFILHFAYVVAVSKTKAWDDDTPFQISMIGLVNLNIIWLKLLIPWRLFRLWALLDGIDTPENMIRLVDNNYSTLAFWRAWHRSYNKWVVRYIYIPLGGSHNRILTSLAVFSFVAIWHDIQLKLLLWGWLIVLFLLPEIIATQYFAIYRNKWWFRLSLCALGGVINIWMMMIANIFGFCLGPDGTKALLKDIFSTFSGFVFFIVASGCIFIAVQVMFEYREEEKRRGINLKC